MKVLHYKSNFLNSSETFIKRLIENNQDFEPLAMCIEKRAFTDICPVFEKPQHGLNSLLNSVCFHLNWCLPFYNKTIKTTAPQIIHAHFGFDGYRMIKPSLKAGIPLVVSFYGSDVSRLPNEFDWQRRYKMLAKYAHIFIAASKTMKQELIELGFPEDNIAIVRFGLDLNDFNFSEDHASREGIMMVGRMVEKKGFIYALEAIGILKNRGIYFDLDLYGYGTLREELEEKSRLWGITELVTFHGNQPAEVIRDACQNHRLLLVPSVTASDGDREGIPNTLLEGMASGISVVATRHSAIPEVVTHKENGLLVPEKDAESLAEMIQLMHSRELDIAALSRKARNHIEKDYSIERMVRETEKLYRSVTK